MRAESPAKLSSESEKRETKPLCATELHRPTLGRHNMRRRQLADSGSSCSAEAVSCTRLFMDEKCWLRSKSPPNPPTSLSNRSFFEALTAGFHHGSRRKT